MPDASRTALDYHRRTRHRLPDKFARSLGFLDWDNQPNPFRLFEGSERVALARNPGTAGPSLDEAYDPSRVEPRPVNAESLAQLLFDSMALSAWKQLQTSRWSPRCNPSSGNLHPTEAYVITDLAELGAAPGPMLWHYTPLLHALERRARLAPELWQALRGEAEGVFVGLSSIHWREAWKYGERAYRYCQHDVGHAIAALAIAAAGLGWQLRALPSVDDPSLARLLALSETPEGPEPEHPDLLLFAGPRPPTHALDLPESLDLEISGEPNELSAEHQRWPIIDTVTEACVRHDVPTPPTEPRLWTGPEPSPTRSQAELRSIVRTRRSAVALDGETSISREAWLRMLARTMPRPGHVPFASLIPDRPRVHLLGFVHRVDGVEPGLYLLLRDPDARERIAAAMHEGFGWSPVDTGALELPLFLLEPHDTRRAAKVVSCHQDIAADGAFALAMLAELGPAIEERGAWMYRHLHWEAGTIGQVLYLEAEAAGVRGTGIGCFFDDGVAKIIGVEDARLASIYHFTLGGPVEDERLTLLDAYHHLDE